MQSGREARVAASLLTWACLWKYFEISSSVSLPTKGFRLINEDMQSCSAKQPFKKHLRDLCISMSTGERGATDLGMHECSLQPHE